MKVGQPMTEPMSYTYRKIEQFHETFWKEYDNEYLKSFGQLRAKSSFKKDAHVLSGLIEREKEKYARGENLSELSISKIDSSVGKMRVSLADEQEQHCNFKKDKERQNKQPFLFNSEIKGVFKEGVKNKQCATSEKEISIDEYMDLNSSKQSIIEPIKDAGQHNFEKEDVQDFILLSEKEEKEEKEGKEMKVEKREKEQEMKREKEKEVKKKKEENKKSQEKDDSFEKKSILEMNRKQSNSSSSSEQDQSEEQGGAAEKIFKERGKEDEGRSWTVKTKASDQKKEFALPQKDCRQQLGVFQPILYQRDYRAKVLDIQRKFMDSVDLSFRTISSYITSLEKNRMISSSQIKYAVRQDPKQEPKEHFEEHFEENSEEDSKEDPEDSKEDPEEDSKEKPEEDSKEKVKQSNLRKRMDVVEDAQHCSHLKKTAIRAKRQLLIRTSLSEPPRAKDHYSSSQEKESSSEDQK